jgi:hypothetical protein
MIPSSELSNMTPNPFPSRLTKLPVSIVSTKADGKGTEVWEHYDQAQNGFDTYSQINLHPNHVGQEQKLERIGSST